MLKISQKMQLSEIVLYQTICSTITDTFKHRKNIIIRITVKIFYKKICSVKKNINYILF